MPGGRKAGEGKQGGAENAPRTDLPPTREPYDDGYFGTGEEEGVEREREAPEPGGEDEKGAPRRGGEGA
jgi:hypothetical protein